MDIWLQTEKPVVDTIVAPDIPATAELELYKNILIMQNITVEELKNRLDAGEKLNIVDVREPYENAEFNIGGTLYPLGQSSIDDGR